MTFPPLAFNAWLRWDVVERVLRRLPTVSSVLEIGAGEGAVATRLASRFEYVGLEPDPTSCAKAQSRLAKLGRGTVLCAEASSLDRDRSFDLVCAFEVLEHIENDAGALLDWKRLLREGGFVLLSVPHDPRRWGPADEKAGHFRRYSRSSLSRLFRETGFEEIEVSTYGVPLGYILESGRNMLARRGGSAGSLADRTAASGRYFQPPDSLGWATRGLTAPFRVLQRPFLAGDRGPGLLALARGVEGGRAAESRREGKDG